MNTAKLKNLLPNLQRGADYVLPVSCGTCRDDKFVPDGDRVKPCPDCRKPKAEPEQSEIMFDE